MNIHFKKMKGRRVKQVFFHGGYQWEVGGHKGRGMRVNMVDVFCNYI
jgi:hypothetical protein